VSSTPEPRSLLLREDGAAIAEESADEDAVAAAVVSGTTPVLRLDRLWVRPDLRRQGHGRRLLALLRTWATEQGATVLSAEVPADDAAMTALTAGTSVLGEFLVKPVAADVDTDVVGHRDLTQAEFGPWRDAQVRAYAEDNLPRSGGDLERSLARSWAEFDRFLPQGLDTADTSLVVLISGDERVGHLWLAHHVEPGLSFVYDVEVLEHHRGRGFGRAAMVVAEMLARGAGDDRIGLHVFGGNAAARNLYRTQGYVLQSTTVDLLAPGRP
jgi:GNAT superfamily N-acetyltransferase